MPRRAFDGLTESMFYVLMALDAGEKCGSDIASAVEKRSEKRVRLGPATLYTILAKFEEEKFIRETAVEGRKRTYTITEKGRIMYQNELKRLKACLDDAEKGEEE